MLTLQMGRGAASVTLTVLEDELKKTLAFRDETPGALRGTFDFVVSSYEEAIAELKRALGKK